MTSIVNEKGLSLTTMDIENIACLVQNELQAIRQIMAQNKSLVAHLKVKSNNGKLESSFQLLIFTSGEQDLNEAIIDETRDV